MPSYRIGQAAELLGVSPDTVRRWADGGRVATTRDEAGRRRIEGADLAAFALELADHHDGEMAGRRSARNRLRGIVTRVRVDGLMAQVELQCGPYRVVSLITSEAAEELRLEPGVLAEAAVKATSVMVERADT